MFNKSSHKNKESLLAQKQRLLQDLKYYEKRIEEAKFSANKSRFEYDNDSSDSDMELPIKLDAGPSVLELKNELSMFKTCLLATQELTNLEVLQSEVNILVDDPKIEGVVVGPGVWREVTADCSSYLVPFCITFFAHTTDRSFAPTTYHNLNVTPVKKNHEAELAKSILPLMTSPSDALEVIRSYALAYRSRRTTLARLADKYSGDLNMSPLPDGGILIKCANLLEVHWTLQNKWSPVAPFQHRMKFDLEYMDEQYIKTITQAHRQLSNPELETNERTLLLAKIVATCLEARGPTQELHDSMSSDPETAKTLQERRTTLDQREEMPNFRKKKDTEVMAPPKSLPKKVKSKENKENERVKRRAEGDDGRSLKKIKTGGENAGNIKEFVDKVTKDDNAITATNKNDDHDGNNEIAAVGKLKNDTAKKSYAKDAKVETKRKNTDNNENINAKKSKNCDELDKESKDKISKSSKIKKAAELKKSVVKSTNNEENTESVSIASKNNEKTDNASETKKSSGKPKNNDGNTDEIAGKISSNNDEKTSKTNKAIVAKSVVNAKYSEDMNAKSIPKKKNENVASEKTASKKINDKNTEAKKSVARLDQVATEKNPKSTKVTDAVIASSKDSDNIQNRNENKVSADKNKQIDVNTNTKGKKAVENYKNSAKDKDTKKLQSKNTAVNNENKTQTNKAVKDNEETTKNKVVTENKDQVSIERNTQTKTKSNILSREPSDTNLGQNKVKSIPSTTKTVKATVKINKENKPADENKKNKMSNDKLTTKPKGNIQNYDKNKGISNIKAKVTKPEIKNIVNKPVISKIPQKKPSPKLKGVTKKLPIRVSPRKHISAKSSLAALKKTVPSNLITNIPRLQTKPTVKQTK